MRKRILPVLLFFAAMLPFGTSCTKTSTGPGDSLPFDGRQTNLPWPSLANSPWPTFAHDFQHTGRSPYRGPQKGEVEWFFEAGNWIATAPVLGGDGNIYFQSLDGFLYSVTPAGILRWKFDMGAASEALVTIAADGTVYACPPKRGIFYALDPMGVKKWEFLAGGHASFGAPILSYDGETIYFAAGDSAVLTYSVFALSKNGTLKWRFTPPQKDLASHSLALSPDGKTLYCPGSAVLYAMDTSGTLRWRYEVNVSNAATPLTSTPCIDNQGNVYFGGGTALISVTAAGALRWQVNNVFWIFPSAPVISWDGTIYITGDQLWAFDRNGSQKWTSQLPGSNSTPAIDKEGTVYLGSLRVTLKDTNNFYAFNPDGTVKFEMVLRNSAGRRVDVTSSPAIDADGFIYVGSDTPLGKRLYKIR